MMVTSQQAVALADEFVRQRGITIRDLKSVRRIEGRIRGEYLPSRNTDFWVVTFSRSYDAAKPDGDLSDEELDILTAVAQEDNTISVAVEMDGTAEIF